MMSHYQLSEFLHSEGLGVRLDTLKKSIERAADAGAVALTSMAGELKTRQGNTVKTTLYYLDKLDAYTILVGISPRHAKRLVVRWGFFAT